MNTPCAFALDIGTRKIAGLVMKKNADSYQIVHTVVKQQLPTAMQDGQIHDIPKVATVIRQVCNEMSQFINQPITKVAVAAAGRSLQTEFGQATIKLDLNQKVSQEKLHQLELSALHDALERVNQPESKTSVDTYLCVGYTTVNSYLDDEPIQNLLNHQGYSASVDIIATFLPRIVIDSLLSALHLAKLEMASLTLEPIAAIHGVIPQSMRLLNLALVDIGAGTSDIAISANGTVKAYGMVSEAGDLITKAIADKYLLDFIEAEQVKYQLNSEFINCHDVLGNQLRLANQSVLKLISPVVTQLASKITREILALNEEAPKGVMLIGGGSLTPGIALEISKQLQLPENLVRVRQQTSFNNLEDELDWGPQLITPICIGYHHLDGLAMELQTVEVNSQVIQFLKLPNTTVGDALVNAGYTVHQLLGTQADKVDIYVNEKPYTLAKHKNNSVNILSNGEPATINTPLKNKDKIEISWSGNKESIGVSLQDVVNHINPGISLLVNGKQLSLMPQFRVNRKKQNLSYRISNGDEIDYEPIKTAGQVLRLAGLNPTDQVIFVKINEERIKLKTKAPIRVNGQPVPEDHPIRTGDRIDYKQDIAPSFILSDIFSVYHKLDEIKRIKQIAITVNGKEAGYTYPLKDGDRIAIQIG